jgi:hypothetical protein
MRSGMRNVGAGEKSSAKLCAIPKVVARSGAVSSAVRIVDGAASALVGSSISLIDDLEVSRGVVIRKEARYVLNDDTEVVEIVVIVVY